MRSLPFVEKQRFTVKHHKLLPRTTSLQQQPVWSKFYNQRGRFDKKSLGRVMSRCFWKPSPTWMFFFVVLFFDPFKPWDGYRHKNIVFGRGNVFVSFIFQPVAEHFRNTSNPRDIMTWRWLNEYWFFCDLFNPKIWGNGPFGQTGVFWKTGSYQPPPR